MTFVSFAQNFEDVMLRRALNDIREGFYVDVGAYDPHADSVTRAFYEAGWRGINLEPNPEGYERFVRYRPRDVNLNVAAGEAPGILPFFDVRGTGLSTLDAAQAKKHSAAGFVVEQRSVPVATLAEICRVYAPDTVHFLKVDCEGSERAALAGADFAAFRPWIVLVEATEPNTQEPSHSEWEPILLGASYRFVWFDGLNRFYVAEERHRALAPSFEAPPNIFDRFTRHAYAAQFHSLADADTLIEAAMPAAIDHEARIAMTTRCRDADPIPKVADAGTVIPGEDGTPVQVMHNGLRVPAGGYYGDWMLRLIRICRGHHEPQEERAFHEVVRRMAPRATMLELGGYWSYYSAWFLQGSPQRRAVVLEPDPTHRAVGERTMALNGLRAEFVSGFVGAVPAESVPFATEESGVLSLPRYTVPQLMEQHRIETLDILHCDTQGAELAVLESCRSLFAEGRIGWAFVSTHAHQISGDPLTHQRCLSLLRASGAAIEAEHDVHESFSGDGLIVARFGPELPDWEPLRLSCNRYSTSLFRNPLYDLAQAAAAGTGRAAMARLVSAGYEALLLRPADGPGLEAFTEELVRTGDIRRFLQLLMTSPEFNANRTAFLSRYLPAPNGTAT